MSDLVHERLATISKIATAIDLNSNQFNYRVSGEPFLDGIPWFN